MKKRLLRAACCRAWHLAQRLAKSRSGLAYIEFAYSFPAVMAIGLYGAEATNLALTHMRVSQIALAMADNTSRIGLDSPLSLTQIRESDVNDSLVAARLQAGRMKLTQRGRIILSSLERNAQGGQWIHWQRCLGVKPYNSSYGVQGDGTTGTSFPGMGPASARVTAPAGNAVMFVEISYDYEPIISASLLGTPRIHYTATFLVRDERDLTQIYNPGNAPVAACSTYGA